MRALNTLCFSLVLMLLGGCLGVPRNVTPVQDFELERYLGTWYEIARLDHSFERGLEQVTAEYSMRDDGGVRVVNRGYSPVEQEWQEAEGRAYFVNDSGQAYLKVSFFGPFFGSYIVFELDKRDYEYAFVSGPNTSYLWFLSRTPAVDEAMISRFVEHAAQLGFDTENLIYPRQKKTE